MSNKNTQIIASGVDQLVQKLKQEGVDAGRQEAEKILAQAKSQAQGLISQAKVQAAEELDRARDQVRREKRAVQESLQVAYRDLILSIKSDLQLRFAQEVRFEIGEFVSQSQQLEKLVLAAIDRILGDTQWPEGSNVEVILPEHIDELKDITQNPQQAHGGALTEFVFTVQEKLLREGVTLRANGDQKGGIRLALEQEKVSLDLTDEAISDLLLSFLSPRFQAILDGIIHHP